MEDRSRHFVGLDGLRGIASAVVVFLHGRIFVAHGHNVPGAACLAVDFFFLLSGFVIAHAYDRRLASGMTWRRFMTVRLIRLYPMLFIGTMMGVLLFALSQLQQPQFSTSLSVFIMLGSFVLLPVGLAVGTLAFPINIAVWSLFFEFAANALYATRFGKLSMRSLALFVALCGIALIPMGIWGGPWIEIGFGNPIDFMLGFLRVSYPFWAGVLLFRMLRPRLGTPAPVPLIGALPSLPMGVIAIGLALLLLAPLNDPAYDLILVLLVFPAVVVLASRARLSNRSARVYAALGRLSYPLYLINVPVFRLINRTAEKTHLGMSTRELIIAGSVVSVIASQVFLTAFDEPIRRFLSNPRQAPKPQAAV